MRNYKPHRTALAAAAVLSLVACGGSSDDGPSPNPTEFSSQQRCERLLGVQIAAEKIGLPTRGATVTAASLKPSAADLPEYCALDGVIASVDTTAEPIKFSLALPTDWNKRFMHLGGGGFNGTVVPASTNNSAFISGQIPLQRRYAVVGSDSGHSEKANQNIGVFALNEEQLRNFAHEQLKKTRDVAAELIRQRYGAAQEKSFFIGGSEGGRESMMAVQRYPADYDGVFSLFPVFNWSSAMFKWLAIGNAMRSNAGAGWLSPIKAKLLLAAEVTACDALDGVNDGIISNIKACSFDAAALRCSGGIDTGDSCLSDAQIATTKVMYSRQEFQYSMADGRRSVPAYYHGTQFAPYPVGAFFLEPLGANPTLELSSVLDGTSQATLGAVHNFGDSFTRFFIARDANFDTLNFDITQPGVHLPRVQQVSALMDATSTDISAFVARGGRWIMAHGLVDPLPLASATSEYYESLVAKYGRATLDKTMRYYTIPGFGHLGGQFAAENGIPALDALEAWVERGVEPGTLVVTDANTGPVNRSRPMCIYPAWPKYKGSGDKNVAANFDCVTE
jgi:feruloyl esterase